MTQLLLGLAVFVIVATSVATVAALLARTNWFFDLFSNFPVQYAVLLALSAVVCLALRQALALRAAIEVGDVHQGRRLLLDGADQMTRLGKLLRQLANTVALTDTLQ